MDTIFAQSTRHGKAGVAVFRISGPNSLLALKLILNDTQASLIPNMFYYKKIYHPFTKELIDNSMVVFFKSPRSFTGEDVVEIHTHGSIAIAKMLLSALHEIKGLRVAEPGEFARRAFLNNKFDLTAAEGLADLIEAETILQHRQALRQAGGELEKLYESWRVKLLTIISLLEAYIDFPEEEIPEETLKTVTSTIEELKIIITNHLNDNRKGEILRSGIKMSIIGPPNVGKSSLLNFMVQREMAIVSNIAGTTRDIIETHLDIGGYPIVLQDTAGIRESNDLIEQEGIKRAIESARNADIKIIMLDVETIINDNKQQDNSFLQKLLKENLMDDNSILILNKIDLNTNFSEFLINNKIPLQVSIKNKIGLNDLLKTIENTASKIVEIEEAPVITRERHRQQATEALQYLTNFNIENDLILATEDIRMTIRVLGTLTGRITVDEILGEIFSKFCIGK